MAFKLICLLRLLGIAGFASGTRAPEEDAGLPPRRPNPFAMAFAKGGPMTALKKVGDPLEKKKQVACAKATSQIASRGNQEQKEMYERIVSEEEAKWTQWCPNGLEVEFVKASSLKDSLAPFSGREKVLLAFDLDGTLNDMKRKDSENTLEVLKGKGRDFEKVVVTAAKVKLCEEVVLPDLKDPSPKDPSNDFATSFGFTEEQSACMSKKVGTDTMKISHGIAMFEYRKAEAILRYLQMGPEVRGQDSQGASFSNPEQVVFYDDFVTNPTRVADHFCFHEAPAGLKKLSVVWFATSEAKARSDRSKANNLKKLDDCTVDLTREPEDSYGSFNNENDARLLAARSLFKGAAAEVTPVEA